MLLQSSVSTNVWLFESRTWNANRFITFWSRGEKMPGNRKETNIVFSFKSAFKRTCTQRHTHSQGNNNNGQSLADIMQARVPFSPPHRISRLVAGTKCGNESVSQGFLPTRTVGSCSSYTGSWTLISVLLFVKSKQATIHNVEYNFLPFFHFFSLFSPSPLLSLSFSLPFSFFLFLSPISFY